MHVLIWWLWMQVFGWLALPVVYAALRWLPDRGYTFAKAAGLLLASYFLWLGGSTGFLYNNLGGSLAALLALGGLSAWLWVQRPELVRSLPAFLRSQRGYLLLVEGLFAAAFLAWTLLRASTTFPRIASAGGEKFMEMAFLTGTLNSLSFPPLDPWLSGFGISYYYFGYVMQALVSRLAGTPVDIAFDLYDALIFALTVVGAFGVVYNLVKSDLGIWARKRVRDQAENPAAPALAGLLGALFVAVLGNLSGLLESLHTRGLLSPAVVRWLDLPDLGSGAVTGSWMPANPPGWVWWWHASRVIQDYDLHGSPVGASPINEFPFFSFLLGDNHPHKLALPFVLLAVALAFNLLRRQLAHPPADESLRTVWRRPLDYLLGGDRGLFLFYAVCLGALGFLNTWDMPIYIGLVVLAYGVGLYACRGRLDQDVAMRSVALGTGLLFTAILLYIFFYLGFRSQAGGVLPYVYRPTRLPQYLVMFGSFIAILLPFLLAHAQAAGVTLAGAVRSWLRVALIAAAGFLLLLGLAAAALLVAERSGSPETANQARSYLGGLDLLPALGAILLARLRDPWLFLLLSLLLGLAWSSLRALTRPQGLPAEMPDPPISPGEGRGAGDDPLRRFPSAALFTLLLGSTALALTFSTEFIYLRDIFGTRMNTIFKFYFQGWVMLALASAYAAVWLLIPGRAILGQGGRTAAAVVLVLAVGAGLVYPAAGYIARSGGFQGEPVLDASIEIAQGNPDDWAAIQYLRSLTRLPAGGWAGEGAPLPLILEAPADRGGQYRYEGRISVFTGLPTLLGWAGHQTQWRGTYDEQARREVDIATIYTTANAQQAIDLLRQWQVQYVIVGGPEIGYISTRCAEPGRACAVDRALSKFAAFEPVFRSGGLTIYRTP